MTHQKLELYNLGMIHTEGVSPKDIAFLLDSGFIMAKRTERAGIVGVMKFMYSYALVSHAGLRIEDSMYSHRFCYPDKDLATLAYNAWDGVQYPPRDGWVKYKGSQYPEHRPDDAHLYALG